MKAQKRVRILAGASAMVMILSANPAIAQANEPIADDAAAATDDEDIVVTGTLIRGVAPTGTNVVELSSEDIVASGATNTNQVLARIPQVTSSFNRTPALAGGSGETINRPNIRNLGAAGGSTTLVLIDGHRGVPAGVVQTVPDPDVIPPGLLARVEVVPDGGSAIYGSDAVGGVINLITKKRFDGIEAMARAGFADDYTTVDGNLTAGTDWGSGSAFVSYAYAQHDALFGRDRDYVQQIADNLGFCSPGTVSITRAGVTTTYALPDRTPGTIAQCDNTDNATFYPKERRHSVFAGITQDLSPSLSFDLRGYYTRRNTTNRFDFNARNSTTYTITSANPYYVPIGPDDPGAQNVNFTFAGVQDDRARNSLDVFQITPSFTAALGGDWQLRVLGSYGRSIVEVRNPEAEPGAITAALAGTTQATALNPYDVGATDPAVLQSIYREFYSNSEQELFNARSIVDGTLFELPGGGVRLAVGAEWVRETYDSFNGLITVGDFNAAPRAQNERTIKSAFGEFVVPVVGEGNSFPGVHSLRLSASARYDDYSDFGSTFNPKFGLTYEPVEWITIRGNWGEAFNAPSLSDLNSSDNLAVVLGVSPFRDPADPPNPLAILRPTIILIGGNSGLQPQTADTWSVGMDLRPPVVPGLTLSATYYNVELTNQIALIPFTSPSIYAPAYAPFVIKDPTLAQAQAFIGGATVTGAPSIEAAFALPPFFLPPYALLDARRNNLGEVKQDGIDFAVDYTRGTSFGSIFANVGGSYVLSRDVAPISGAAFTNVLQDPGASRLSLVASAGAKIGDFLASITASHSAGYDIVPITTSGFGTQDHVDSFTTVDLFFQYDLEGLGFLEETALTLNVNNVFDEAPPFFNAGSGFTNGSTLGRLVQVGIRTKF